MMIRRVPYAGWSAATSTMSGNSRMLLMLGFGLAAGLFIFRR